MWKLKANSPTGWNRRLACGVLLVWVACQGTLLAGMPRAVRQESRHEIDQLEEVWRNALLHRNIKAMDNLLADDYMAITPSGMLESRDQTLANMRSGAMRFDVIEISDRKVRFYGTTAVVTSRAYVNGTTPEGALSGAYRFTRVYIRDDAGVWKIVSFEASRVRGHQKHP
jgi:ketosteroid isomerase-like protein